MKKHHNDDEAAMATAVVSQGRDPFTLELIKNSLASIADEMALTVARTARSVLMKEALDFSTALFDAKGAMIAQGTCLPLHLGALPFAVAAVQREFGEDIHPGDIFALNDPYDGSTHLPDIICVSPIFLDGAHIGFSTVLGHMTDIGGRVPGGNATDSTEIFQEGLRIPPVRLYDRGKPNHAVFQILKRNVRVPGQVLGDLQSQVAGCHIGERGILKLAANYGREEFDHYCGELLDYTERFTRSEIEQLSNGTYSFTDYLDGDGVQPGMIKFQVAVTVDGDCMTIDFTGSSPQVRGAINSVYAFTVSTALACVRSILNINIPNNAGYFRPITVIAPDNSIVNPRPPAAVAARGITAFRLADALFGALSQIRPDLIPAAGGSSPETGVSFGGYDSEGEPFVFVDFLIGSWGGGPWRDGMEACSGMIANVSNTPAEVLESEYPLAVTQYGFVPDTGGLGEFRGGLAMRRCIRVLADETVTQVRSDRRDIPPYGLNGGHSGTSSAVWINRANGDEELPPAKFITTLRKGDEICFQLASGGGYGTPLNRACEHVLHDVLEGKSSIANAQDAYGVVIAGEPPQVDIAATRKLRIAMRKAQSPAV